MSTLRLFKDKYDIPAFTLRYSISPSGTCEYKDFWVQRNRKRREIAADIQLKTENERKERGDKTEKVTHERFKHNGIMSEFSIRKMRKSIQWLEFAATKRKMKNKYTRSYTEFRLAFVTLTLPSTQKHTDQVIKRSCLNNLLIELRKFHGMRNYIWRAEKQVNGNIHFHLITDSWIDAYAVRKRWNRIVNTLGYVDEYTQKMTNEIKTFNDYLRLFKSQGSYKTLLKRYHHGRATKWSDPNSTDIHSTKNIECLEAYLMKYMSKNVAHPERLSEEERNRLLVNGQLWGLSESITKMRTLSINEQDDEMMELGNVFFNESWKVMRDEFFEFRSVPITRYFAGDCPLMALLITKHIRENLNPQFNPLEVT